VFGGISPSKPTRGDGTGLGFSVDNVIKGACFRLFGQVYLALGDIPTSHFFG